MEAISMTEREEIVEESQYYEPIVLNNTIELKFQMYGCCKILPDKEYEVNVNVDVSSFKCVDDFTT